MFEEEKVDLEPTEETPEPEVPEEGSAEELEKERKLRQKAESAAQRHREEAEKLRKESASKEDLKELEAKMTRTVQRQQVLGEIQKVARTPKEAEDILKHYEQSLVPTGDVVKDVARAKLLASEDGGEEEEAEAAEASKERRGKEISGGKHVDDSQEPSLDAETRQLISMNRMTWDAKSKTFKNERGVSYNPKTGEVTDPRRK